METEEQTGADRIADGITKHLIDEGTTNEDSVREFLSSVSKKVLTRVAAEGGLGLNFELPE
jgi:hypothetical protein